MNTVKRRTNKTRKVIIVGAGPGGLAAAMILQHRGFDVEIFEKEPVVGGRNSELIVNDFRFDTGPTMLILKNILDEVFEDAGVKSSDYLTCIPLDPLYRVIFPDLTLDILPDRKKMRSQIKKIFPGEEKGFDRFLKKEGKRFEKLYPLLRKDFSSWLSYMSPTFLKALPYIPFGRSISDHLERYFHEEKLRLAFSSQSSYLGMSPWECPAVFATIPFAEYTHGLYHVRGGLSRITKVMQEIIESRGGKIHLNTPVKRLILKKREAKGVLLENKKRVYADTVILNANFAYAINKLISKGTLTRYAPEVIQKRRHSCSTFMVYLGLDTVFESVPHHTYVFPQDYKKYIESVFSAKKLPHDLALYIQNPSVIDETLAPKGKSTLYVMVQVPNNTSKINWYVEEQDFVKHILQQIEARTPFKHIQSHIESIFTISPKEWEEKNVYHGSVYNLDHTLMQMLYFRPHNIFEDVSNCFLVGGGTHPGNGLPSIYRSAQIAADLISHGK
jgi:phytoene desaturase